MEGIPRGVEVLVKKASVDPEFRRLLIGKRAEAAKEIGLDLDPTEIAMIDSVPEAQLESIISRTIVLPRHRAAFLGKVAAVMLLTLGTITLGSCGGTKGEQPDRPETLKKETQDDTHGVQGERPDRPYKETEEDEGVSSKDETPNEVPAPTGVRPDRPPSTRGISPR